MRSKSCNAQLAKCIPYKMIPISRRQSGPAPLCDGSIAARRNTPPIPGPLLFTLISIRRKYNQVRSRGLLKQTFITGRTPIDGLSPVHVVGGRVLLLFTALLLIVMPWTEYYWHFDRFLRGGQDCEFGILFIATFFSLALVLSQCRKQTTAFILTVRRWISDVFHNTGQPALGNLHELIAALHTTPVPDPSLGTYNQPLQI
jgi:hypothetical protein